MNYETNEFDFAKSLLVPGENILWKGKPEKSGLLTKRGYYMIPFSLLWCGIVSLSVVDSIIRTGFVELFDVPFILAGLYLLVGRFIITVYTRRITAYVITNKKIIRKIGKNVDMLEMAALPPMYIELLKDGRGSIGFGAPVYNTGGRTRDYVEADFTIENIANVVKIQELIDNIEK